MIAQTRKYFIEEIKQIQLINKKQENVYKILNYIEHFFFQLLWSQMRFISALGSSNGFTAGISSSAIEIKICAINALINMYKSMNEKKNKKDQKVVLSASTKFNTKKVLICKALTDSNISLDEFVSVNNMLKEYDDIKEEIKKF